MWTYLEKKKDSAQYCPGGQSKILCLSRWKCTKLKEHLQMGWCSEHTDSQGAEYETKMRIQSQEEETA